MMLWNWIQFIYMNPVLDTHIYVSKAWTPSALEILWYDKGSVKGSNFQSSRSSNFFRSYSKNLDYLDVENTQILRWYGIIDTMRLRLSWYKFTEFGLVLNIDSIL